MTLLCKELNVVLHQGWRLSGLVGVMEEKESPGGRLVTKVLAKRVTTRKDVETLRLTFKREGGIENGSFGDSNTESVLSLEEVPNLHPLHHGAVR